MRAGEDEVIKERERMGKSGMRMAEEVEGREKARGCIRVVRRERMD